MLIHPASEKDIFFHDRVERKDPMSGAKGAGYDYCILRMDFKLLLYASHNHGHFMQSNDIQSSLLDVCKKELPFGYK